MSCTKNFKYYRRFSEGREELEENEYPGQPTTSTTDENIQKNK